MKEIRKQEVKREIFENKQGYLGKKGTVLQLGVRKF